MKSPLPLAPGLLGSWVCETIATMLRFDEKLPLRSKSPIPGGMRPGPCAMGPAEDGVLPSMHVWIFQQTAKGPAVASGDNREQQPSEAAPLRWRVATGLDPASQDFAPDKPAVAMAMALVREEDGRLEVQHWSQAVIVTDKGDVRQDDGTGLALSGLDPGGVG